MHLISEQNKEKVSNMLYFKTVEVNFCMKKLYDENRNLVNVSNSLLRHYGLETFHPSLKELDAILDESKNKKICLILLDGFGKHIQELHSSSCRYILSHNKRTITSVFPPTTTSATTSLLTGKYPIETGWLGWTEKLPEYDVPCTRFLNTLTDENKTKIKTPTLELYPYVSIFDQRKEKGIKGTCLQSFRYPDRNIESFFARADKALKESDFLYLYHVNPDELLHEYGTESEEVDFVIKKLNEEVEKLTKSNPDTLFLLMADHGHKNGKHFDIEEYEDFYSLLEKKWFSIEPRAASFLIKKGKEDEFRKVARKHYGEHFYIYSKKEALEENIFGLGKMEKRIPEILGDFILISKDESAFKLRKDNGLVSHHAGSSDDEKYINISVYNN